MKSILVHNLIFLRITKNAFIVFFVLVFTSVASYAIDVNKNGFYFCSVEGKSNEVFCYGYNGSANKITIPTTITHFWKQYKVVAIKSYKDDLSVGIGNNNRYSPVFSLTNNVETVIVPDGIDIWCRSGKGLFECNHSIKSVRLPSGVKEIPDNTFKSCSSLESVIVPYSVKRIGAYAFGGCVNLQSIRLYENLEEIGANAFDGCVSLQSIRLYEGLAKIGARAFANTAIRSLRLPASLSEIEKGLYGNWHPVYDFADGCNQLISLVVQGANPIFATDNGVLYNKDMTEILYCIQESKGTLYLPSSVEYINDLVFSHSKFDHIVDRENISPELCTDRMTPYCGYEGTLHLPYNSNNYPKCNINYFPETIIERIYVENAVVGMPIFLNITEMFNDHENDPLTFHCSKGKVTMKYSVWGKQFFYSYTPTQESSSSTNVSILASDGYGWAKAGIVIQSIKLPIQGNVNFTQTTPIFDQPIEVQLLNTTYDQTDLEYQWKLDGYNISGATNSSFTPDINHINRLLSVEIYAYDKNNILEANAGIVQRQPHPLGKPNRPTLNSKTTNSVTLNVVAGCEYAINGIWQSMPIFDGLISDTEYIFTQRYTGSDIFNPSDESDELHVRTAQVSKFISDPSNLKSTSISTNYETDEINERFKVYPNPSNGKITIQSPDINKSGSVKVYSLSMQLVVNKSINAKQTMSIDHLKQGSYIVILSIGKDQYSQKLIVY